MVAESASLVQHLGEGGGAGGAADGAPVPRTSKPRAARATNFAGMCRSGSYGNTGGDSDNEQPEAAPRPNPRKRGRPPAASAHVSADTMDRENVVPIPVPEGAKRPRYSRSPAVAATPQARDTDTREKLLSPFFPVVSRPGNVFAAWRDSAEKACFPSSLCRAKPATGAGGGAGRHGQRRHRRRPGAQDALAHGRERGRPGTVRTPPHPLRTHPPSRHPRYPECLQQK